MIGLLAAAAYGKEPAPYQSPALLCLENPPLMALLGLHDVRDLVVHRESCGVGIGGEVGDVKERGLLDILD